MIPSVALDPPLVASLAVTGAAAGGLGLALAALGFERMRRLGRRLEATEARAYGSRRTFSRAGAAGPDAAVPLVGAVDLRTDVLEASTLDAPTLEAPALDAPVPITRADAIRNVAVVRYDAFPGIGGQMSFSAALLDDAGDGLVLTVINGRNEARTYAKDIRDGTSIHRLSEDEIGAIDQALGRTRAT